MKGDIQTVISGSFRKHYGDLLHLKNALEGIGIIVLSPAGTAVFNPTDEFAILDTDPVTNCKMLQDSVFAKIRASTFLTLANVDGYIGKAALLEVGYAIACGLDVYTLEEVEDPNISPYCTPLTSIFPEIFQEV